MNPRIKSAIRKIRKKIPEEEQGEIIYFLKQYERYKKAFEYLLTKQKEKKKEEKKEIAQKIRNIFRKNYKQYIKKIMESDKSGRIQPTKNIRNRIQRAQSNYTKRKTRNIQNATQKRNNKLLPPNSTRA